MSPHLRNGIIQVSPSQSGPFTVALPKEKHCVCVKTPQCGVRLAIPRDNTTTRAEPSLFATRPIASGHSKTQSWPPLHRPLFQRAHPILDPVSSIDVGLVALRLVEAMLRLPLADGRVLCCRPAADVYLQQVEVRDVRWHVTQGGRRSLTSSWPT